MTDMASMKPKRASSTSAAFEVYGLSKKQFAETIGLSPEALYKSDRLGAAKTQTRLREMKEISTHVSAWAGGPAQAMAWGRAEPIPAFGARTAKSWSSPVRRRRCAIISNSIALGGFA